MTYAVKEIFYTLQGEGANAGRPAVFCRFAGCNLWSGREEDRAGAMCRFCDTDFVGLDGENGGKYRTVDALHRARFTVAIETNGTLPVLSSIDWICVSPKADTQLIVTQGNELKVVIPQDNQRLAEYEALDFAHFFVQPMDGPSRNINTRLAIDWCKRHPLWRLSIQTHKHLGIP